MKAYVVYCVIGKWETSTSNSAVFLDKEKAEEFKDHLNNCLKKLGIFDENEKFNAREYKTIIKQMRKQDPCFDMFSNLGNKYCVDEVIFHG